MREIRLSGSEGGGDHRVSPYLYQSAPRGVKRASERERVRVLYDHCP